MVVRDLIEMLAKQNWNAQPYIDTRQAVSPAEMCNISKMRKIKSISAFTSKGKPVIALNTKR